MAQLHIFLCELQSAQDVLKCRVNVSRQRGGVGCPFEGQARVITQLVQSCHYNPERNASIPFTSSNSRAVGATGPDLVVNRVSRFLRAHA